MWFYIPLKYFGIVYVSSFCNWELLLLYQAKLQPVIVYELSPSLSCFMLKEYLS